MSTDSRLRTLSQRIAQEFKTVRNQIENVELTPGPPGDDGADGSTWWDGPELVPPAGMPWKIGDYFLSTTSGDVFRNQSTW